MPSNLHLSITGDASSALSELAKVQAAINSLSGKTVKVRVDVDGGAKALGDMRALNEATDNLTRSTRQHSRAARTAAKNIADHGAAAELAGEAMRNYGGDVDRVGGNVQRTRADVDRANSSVSSFDSSAARTTRTAERLGGVMRNTGGGFVDAIGNALTLGRGLGAVGQGAFYATAGAGLLTAGVGALGVGSAAALGGIGVGLGAAAAGVTAFTVDSLKDMQGFKGAFENIGRAAQGYSAWISEPYGAALVSMADQTAASAPALAAPLRASFADIGAAAQRGLPGMLGAAAYAVKGFQDVTTASIPAFDAFFQNLPALAQASIDPVRNVADTFGRVAGKAFAEGVPAYKALTGAVGDFGSTIVRIGADNFAPALDGMTSLTRGATSMATELAPAIRPSMQAFTDFAGAMMQAVGNSAPAIADFARTVSRNAYGLQQATEGFIQGGLAIGGAIVDIGGQMGPAIKSLGSGTQSFLGWADSFGSTTNSVLDTILGFRRNAQGYVSGGPGMGALPLLLGGGGAGTAGLIGRGAGMVPGQFSGFTAGWTRGADGSLGMGLAAGAAEEIQRIQNRIDRGGLSAGQERMLRQAQRYAARGNAPPEFAFAGRPGGVGEYHSLLEGVDSSAPGPGAVGAPSAGRTPLDQAGRPSYTQPRRPPGPPPRPAPPPGGRSGGGFWSGLMDSVFGPGISNLVSGAGGGIGGLLGNLFSGATTGMIAPGMGSIGTGAPALAQNVRAIGQAASQAASPMQTFRSAVSGAFSGAALAPQSASMMRGAVQSVAQGFAGVAPMIARAAPAIAPAVAGVAAAIPQAMTQAVSTPAPVQATQRMVSRVQNVAPQAAAAGADIGGAIGTGAGGGITKTETRTLTIVRRWTKRIIDSAAEALGIASPSRVFMGMGEEVGAGTALGVQSGSGAAVAATANMAETMGAVGGGLGAAFASASDGVQGVASDRGLMVGYAWARSVVTGADSVLKRADFIAAGIPQVESAQAKAALGAAGLLGPAGSGASIWKTRMVTLGPTTPAAPQKVEVHVNLDGQPFRQMTVEQINTAFDELAASITRQVG